MSSSEAQFSTETASSVEEASSLFSSGDSPEFCASETPKLVRNRKREKTLRSLMFIRRIRYLLKSWVNVSSTWVAGGILKGVY